MDKGFIVPFLSAAMNVLKIQTNTVAKPGVPQKKDPHDAFHGDVSGVIGLVCNTFTGSVVITFPEKTFLAIMSRMLGEEIKTLSPDIVDGAGELTNIIFGQAKVALNEKGFGVQTALPNVITGKDHSIMGISKGPRVSVPFETDIGNFTIEICLSE